MTTINTTLRTQTCSGFCSEMPITPNITGSDQGLSCFNTADTETSNYSGGVVCLSRSTFYNQTEQNITVTTIQNFTTTVTEVASNSSTSATVITTDSFGSSKPVTGGVTLTRNITPADTSVSSSGCRSISVHRSFVSFALIIILSMLIAQIHVLPVVKM